MRKQKGKQRLMVAIDCNLFFESRRQPVEKISRAQSIFRWYRRHQRLVISQRTAWKVWVFEIPEWPKLL